MIIKLNEKIDCLTLCTQIERMVKRYQKDNSLENKIISIKIVDIVDGGDKHIPKLEYKQL